VEVALDWSWIVTFVLAAWTLVSAGARLMPHLSALPLTMLGVAAAAGLFASLVAHEVAHGVAARACGVPVRHITLFLLGGITDAEREPSSPRSEVVCAIAAPLASLAIGFLAIAGIAIASGPLPRSFDDLDRLGAPGVVVVWLGLANVVIAAVNLLPAYPLDGGRLLRAAFWSATGDVERSTRWAAWLAQGIGWLLVVLGVALAFSTHGPGVAAAMWTAFVGWFIASAAAQGYEGVRMQDALGGVTAGRLMRTGFVAIPADMTVNTAMRTFLVHSDGRGLPVVDGRELVGLLSFSDVRELPAPSWRTTLVRDIASRPERLVSPRTPVLDIIDTLDRAPVVDGNKLVGVLDREDVVRFMEGLEESSNREAPVRT
jgi:Zn-dependent protease/CBS domain-containing protein